MDIQRKFTVLIAEDDEDDFFFLKRALERTNLVHKICWVRDGQELLDYFLKRDLVGNIDKDPFPHIIVTDLNMPKKNGMDALKEIKLNEKLKHIPIVIFTTSKDESDIVSGYKNGACSFIRKPIDLNNLDQIADNLTNYWIRTTEVPVAL